ncbi:MAG: DUF4869 domain-containing protein [Oscillospiraceae bacterium]|nr:DUF4869 domain-containing protein [Oscillospiraceae bacterium]MBR3536994.1 DUF4869 domain-containing protein [Oscillospiraceae bacterium]
MLKIFFGEMENAVYNTSLYFKNRFNPRWMEDERTVKMIKDVDKSEVLGNGAVSSPVMGIIAPVSLSGGVKTLILIDQINDKVFNASNCGDNCARWLLEMGREKDVVINLRHLMDFGDGQFDVEIMNTGETVHNMYDLAVKAGRFV